MSASTQGISKGTICRWFGYSRQAHHQRLAKFEQRVLDEEMIIQLTSETRTRAGRRLGTKKVFHEVAEKLQSMGIKCGRDRFYNVLRSYDMLIRPKRKRSIRTTDSSRWLKQFDDLAKGFKPTGPDQLWVADITYLWTKENPLYLSLITDAYSRQIMGWRVHDNLKTQGPLLALEQALQRRSKTSADLIHHSDRGCQYCSKAYIRVLAKAGIRSSTTQDGSPYDNALAESVNGQLKVEYDLERTFESAAEARNAVVAAIQKYNLYRPHGSLGMRKPADVHYAMSSINRNTELIVKPKQDKTITCQPISVKPPLTVK